MFNRYPSLSRFSQGWTITEKIDGTNSQIVIDRLASADDGVYRDQAVAVLDRPLGEGEEDNPYNNLYVFAGSRNRLITPESDNMGFARWVRDNAAVLADTLGEGRHYGEWWGQGIQRGYGLREKRFSLFNAIRWQNVALPDGVYTVPAFVLNGYLDNPGESALVAMNRLKEEGSLAAPGYDNPEGIVMYHRASDTGFKKTFDYDEAGKWAENMARKAYGGQEVVDFHHVL